jgi:hypothetical protein
MNETELKQFIESRGYMEVTVKSYAKSCRIHYCTSIDSITLNLKAKVSDLPIDWLNKRFEPLLRTATITLSSKGGK